jgi:hypothetical protein
MDDIAEDSVNPTPEPTKRPSLRPLCPRWLISLFGIVLVNLLPILGIVFSNWDLYDVMTVYWAENLIIGAFTVLKMLSVNSGSENDDMTIAVAAPFFIIVYSAFCFGQAILIQALFKKGPSESPIEGWPVEWFVFGGLFATAFIQLKWMALMMALNHGIAFVHDYILPGPLCETTFKQLIAFPSARLVIMQTILIAAGFGLKKLGSPPELFIGLIVLKIILELLFDQIEQRTLADDIEQE